jgi:type I restriction enzyme S subunit
MNAPSRRQVIVHNEVHSRQEATGTGRWRPLKLRDVCKLINGRAYSQPELLSKGKYRVLRVGNFFTNNHWYYSDFELDDNKYCDTGDLLYAWSASFGPRIWAGEKVIFHYHIWKVIPDPALIDQKFLYMFFRWDTELIKEQQGTGTTMIHVTKSSMEDRDIPVPPVPEQRRIVAKLESLSTRSKNARDELARIPRLVERYKEAILAAAFRGDLTAEWRRKNKPQQLGVDLLSAMLAEHTKVTGHKSPHKRPDLDLREAENLPPLPKSWTWIPVGFLASKVTDGVHKKPNYVDTGVPFLTVRNLTAGPGISLSECRYVTEADHNEFIKRTHPEYGDILISKDGTLGVVRAVRTKTVFSIFVSLALVKPVDRTMTDYLELAFSAPQVQQQMVGVGTGLQHIHLNDLRRDLIPIAPAGERDEIVLRVKVLFDAIDRLYAETTRAIELVDRLDDATLGKAFRGELVPGADNSGVVALKQVAAQ